VYANGTQADNKDYTSIFLYNKDVKNDSSIHIYCKFKLIIRNCDDYSYYYTNNGNKNIFKYFIIICSMKLVIKLN